MLQMETNHRIIILYYREGLSIRKIARELNIHRNTVKARIEEHERFKSCSTSEISDPGSAMGQYFVKGHTYNSSGRKKRRLTDAIVAIIDECLQENEAKKLDGRQKQQMRRIDIHERILSSGHCISYSVICEYIQKRLAWRKEAFIRQEYTLGDVCEFDWGEVKLNIGDKYRRYYLSVFTCAYSNYRYSILYQRQDTLGFKESHIRFFEHMGGVFHQFVYDNMRVAVSQFVGKTEKQPTAALLELSRWYQFEWRFCNTYRGNEKGHVERSVEYIRRKVFAFKDSFSSIEEAQEYLIARVGELNERSVVKGQQSPAERLKLEKPNLYPYPGNMECFSGEYYRVDKYATVCFGTNRYSVPDNLCGRMVFIKAYANQLSVYDNNKVVCTHVRSYERYGWHIDVNHYLNTLQKKPGALAGSSALKQAPDWLQSMYMDHFRHDSRGFIELLQYCQLKEIPDQKLIQCVEQLIKQYPSGITAEYVMAVAGNQPSVSMHTESNKQDPIVTRSMQNLMEMTLMMELN
jgi:transposase